MARLLKNSLITTIIISNKYFGGKKMLSKRVKKFFAGSVFVVMMSLSLVGCTNDYEDTLKSGIEKYDNGETMTEEEYNAVKNFNEWSDKQGEKTYDEWDQ